MNKARTKQTDTTSFNDALIEAVYAFVSGYVEIQEFAVRGTLCLSMSATDEMMLRDSLAVIINDWLPMSITEANVSVADVQSWVEQLLKFEVRKHMGLTTYYWPNVTF